MLNLTLSDLIALREHCCDWTLNITISEEEVKKWHDRFKQVDKELSDRVEKIFENNG